ncbi:malate dehydrogenase [Parvicella tangerina]|uniref:L-lactate dehydrogenase 1 n=1 Tax=Parvicella tangerina TaxID=2829795 RepID=A0A916JND1_9FLAO|nr:hypothetical protein [Parvicella tangerina]CAG5083219.1 L-lactate dehydrogenase 1 [Parvicella tangerina]
MDESTPVYISIIGPGKIGRTLMLSLINQTKRRYVINIVSRQEVLSGFILDIVQSLQLKNKHRITLNSTSNFNRSSFIFHCAGVSVKQGASRLTTSKDNIAITKELFEKFRPNKDAKVIVITNPVDIISYYTWKFTGLPPKQIIGTGTLLDTIRLHYYMEELVGADKQIETLMLGEHGESIVWAKSHSKINGGAIEDYFTEEQQAKLELDVIHTAARIKQNQGASTYAISLCALEIMEAMIEPDGRVYTVSCLLDEYYKQLLQSPSIYMGLPAQLDQNGVKAILPLKFTPDELAQLQQSAALIESHLIH